MFCSASASFIKQYVGSILFVPNGNLVYKTLLAAGVSFMNRSPCGSVHTWISFSSALWMARKYKAPHECWCIETNLLINGCFFHTAVPVHPSCSIMELCYQSIYMFTAIRLMIHGLKTLVQHDAAKELPKDNLCVPATRATADRTAVFDTLLLLSCWAQAAVDTQEQIWRLNMSSYTNTSWNHTASNRLTNRAWCL